jgi:chromosome segregation ATPase
MEYLCKYCEVSFKRKGDLGKHYLTIKCKEKQNKYQINEQLNNNMSKIKEELEIYKTKEIEYNKNNKILENKIQELTEEVSTLKNEIKVLTLKTEIKTLEKSTEEYRKIVEKAATKSTNTVKNYQHNNYLNYISSEPINFSNLKNQLKDIVTPKSPHVSTKSRIIYNGYSLS